MGLRLLATAEQDRDLASMSRAFEINLKALSLLALLVGLFVVFQTLGFLTLRRGSDRLVAGARRRSVQASGDVVAR